jgi:hypothetical protein
MKMKKLNCYKKLLIETFDIHIYKMYRTKVDWVIQLHEMRSFFRNVHILIK